MLKQLQNVKSKFKTLHHQKKNPPVIFYMLEHLKVASINDNMIQK